MTEQVIVPVVETGKHEQPPLLIYPCVNICTDVQCVYRFTCCFLTISSLVLNTGASSTSMPSAISFTFSRSSVLYLPFMERNVGPYIIKCDKSYFNNYNLLIIIYHCEFACITNGFLKGKKHAEHAKGKMSVMSDVCKK